MIRALTTRPAVDEITGGPTAQPVDPKIKRLIDQLKTGDEQAQRSAAFALGEMGPAAAPAAPAVLDAAPAVQKTEDARTPARTKIARTPAKIGRASCRERVF